MRAIVWLRQDLRLQDNPALNAAVKAGYDIVPAYILDDEQAWAHGGASRWWLHHSLASLHSELEALGGTLVLERGDSLKSLKALCKKHKVDALYWNTSYEPAAQNLERDVHKALRDSYDIHRYAGALLFEPELIKTDGGNPYKVFTPFYKKCLSLPGPSAPTKLSTKARFAKVRGDKLENWKLLPSNPDWAAGLRESWKPGSAGAKSRLRDFIKVAVTDYSEQRDIPAVEGTSRLSPHLHFGEISARQIWATVSQASSKSANKADGARAYLRELLWRDFAYYLLHHWPTLPEKPFKDKFAAFPWQDDPKALATWQQGKTGYPLVDAGMRQLWQTGWMHNRVRMVVASFLVKHLLQPWQSGEAWFWDTLVDADLANNAASWQWVAGCGADAAPYFRIFNPTLQSKKFDANGDYIREFVPELALMPAKYIHEPHAAPAEVLLAAGVEIDRDYPAPIIEHSFARERALESYKSIKSSEATI